MRNRACPAVLLALCAGIASVSVAAETPPASQPATQPTTGPVLKSWEEMRDVRVPHPTEYASVFTFGYMNDIMPKTPEAFEKLLVKIKAGGFNVIHCAYKDWRLELCRKHGVKMMVDLLARPYRFFTDRERVKALCIKLRGDKAVWGYNLWNDRFGPHGPGLNQRMVRIRTWDPTHPTFAGTYRTIGIKHLRNTDCFGYYDYHWTRGRHNNFLHLSIYRYWVMRRNAIFLRWTDVTCGKGYKQIRRRAMYTINTSIAWGMKGSLWFLGQNMVKGDGWSDAGRAITEVNHEVMPMRKWIMKIGNPSTVVSTKVKGRSGKLALPKYTSAVPKDFWLQPTAGEFLMGVFQDALKQDYIFCANHSISAAQTATIQSAKPIAAELFDRKKATWTPLKVTDNTFTFKIAPSGGELLRLTQKK